MSSQGQTPHPSELCSTPSTRSCALYRGCITVRRAGPKLVAKRRRQLCKDSAKGCVACSAELAGCLFEPVQSYDHRRSFVTASFGIRAMPAGLPWLWHGLHHGEEAPSRAGERNRSRSRCIHTKTRHLDSMVLLSYLGSTLDVCCL